MNFIVSVLNRTLVIKILKTNNKKAAITNNTPHEILKTMTNYSLKADLKTYFALSLHPHNSSGNTLCFAIVDFGTQCLLVVRSYTKICRKNSESISQNFYMKGMHKLNTNGFYETNHSLDV